MSNDCPVCVGGCLPWNQMVRTEECTCVCTYDEMTQFLGIVDNLKDEQKLKGLEWISTWSYALSKGYIKRDILQDLKVVLTRHGKQVLANTKARWSHELP